MAVETGTATDHYDLYNKLYNFLTSNDDLVDEDQNWEEVWTHPDASHPVDSDGTASQFMLKGKGLGGNDEIFVSFSLRSDPDNDRYGLSLCGNDGVVSSSPSFSDHLNTSDPMWMPMFPNSMPYWFVANGRRFVVVCTVSTVYEACSAGLFLPYCLPENYPYPVYVGGSSEDQIRYSADLSNHTHFINPGPRSYYREDSEDGGDSLRVRLPGGKWHRFRNYNYPNFPAVYPYLENRPGLLYSRKLIGDTGYMLSPVVLLANESEVRGALGFFQGIYHVPGYGNASGNIITVDGTDHLVVQNAFRTSYESFWALALK